MARPGQRTILDGLASLASIRTVELFTLAHVLPPPPRVTDLNGNVLKSHLIVASNDTQWQSSDGLIVLL